MALSDFLNKDPFAAGGVMDAPDVQTRTAMFKLAAGLPMDNKEIRRLVVRQGLEQQSMQTAQDAARKQALLGMGGVDVRSYAGSMWAQPGSYTAARPLGAQTGYSPEATADALLKQRFGTMQPGQMQIAYGGSREGQVQVRGGQPNVASFLPSNISVAQPTAPVGLGESVTTPTQGVTGPAPQAIEAIMAGPGGSGSNSGQIGFMGGMAPVGQMQDINITPGAVTPNQAAIDSILGTPQPMAAPIARQMPAPSAFGQQPFAAPQAPSPSTLQQLTAINQQYGQLPQPMALEASTPRQQALAQQQQHFQTTQQRMMAEQQQKQRMATATSMVATGQDISSLGLNPSELAQAYAQGAIMSKKGITKTREDVNGVPMEITRDITGKEIGRSAIQQTQLTPQQAFDLEQAKIRAQREEEARVSMSTDIEKQVQAHYRTTEQTAELRKSIAQGARQGPGADLALNIMKGVNAIRPGTFDTTKEELLKQGYSELALTAAAKMKGQGQITETERKLLASTVAQYGNTPQAALYMMDVMDAVSKREIARADAVSEAKRSGRFMTTAEMSADFYKANPLDKFLTVTPYGAGQAQPASGQPAGKVRVYDPATRSFK